VGNLAEGLIFKASRASSPSSPQSYPQFFGMTFKALQNQQLTSDLKSLHNHQIHQRRQNTGKM
jgi:hypothetical protein